MSEIDKRNRSTAEPFANQTTKKGTGIIYHNGKKINIIKDSEAERLIARIKEVEDNITEVQLLLAKITGNFKRGNEKKIGKSKRK